ncbi:hypothetical protein Glove_308g43 [Diversispora epigaea]|uniref:HTH psq-type domain-containing protein n=1 Tax=Diversispora epigaea TaxID=1348612 RepID=A0A397HZ20_9GLOM|nr:hypothetical protein Glove_308g43 [Diversispora epigaea]
MGIEILKILPIHWLIICEHGFPLINYYLPAAEKLTIIADAKALSCRVAARKHGVDYSMVSRWINNEEKIKMHLKRIKA